MHQKEPSRLHMCKEKDPGEELLVFLVMTQKNSKNLDALLLSGNIETHTTHVPWGHSILQCVPRRQLDSTLSSCHGCGCSLASSTRHPNKHAQRNVAVSNVTRESEHMFAISQLGSESF